MIKSLVNKIIKNRVYLLITIGIFLLSLLTFGRAYLQTTLSINGNTKMYKNTWIIHFDAPIEFSEDSKTALMPADIIDYEKTKMEFNVHLEQPGDLYEYTVWVVNDGTVDAMVESVEKSLLTEEQQKYLDFEVKYDTGEEIKRCDYLFGTDSRDNKGLPNKRLIKVTVKFKDGIDFNDYPKDDVDLRLYFAINYVQWDVECPLEIVDTRILTIRPNGGTYDNRKATQRVYIEPGKTYTMKEVTRALYNFEGWEVILPQEGGTYTFDGSTFTMGNEDVTVVANWKDGNYVARIMDTYYPTIQEAFDDVDERDWEDNTVWLLKDTTEYPTNNTPDAFTFNMDGHTVTGTMTNSTVGKLTLVNGRIEAEAPTDEDAHDEAVINYGRLNLGIDDGVVEVENSIALVGNEVGLYNKKGSKFYFYDGYIEGVSGLVGGYTDKAANHYVFVNHNSERNCQKVYLVRNPNRAVAKTLTQGELYYYNLQDGINSVSRNKARDQELDDDDYVLYAIRNFEAAYNIDVKADERIFFELVGYEVQFGEPITNAGHFEILNKEEIMTTIKPSMTTTNTGELVINNVYVLMTTDFNGINNTGKLDIQDTHIKSKKGYAVNNGESGTIKFNAVTDLKADSNYALYNSSSALVIDAGNIRGLHNTNGEGSVTVTGAANFRPHSWSDGYVHTIPGIYNTGNMVQSGADVSSENGIAPLWNVGTYTITAGRIYGPTYSIDQNISNGWGTLNVEGGDITSQNKTIHRGTVNVKNNAEVSSINGPTLYDGTLNLYSGKVYNENDVTIDYSNIYIYGGELIAGENSVATRTGTFYIEGGKVTSENGGIVTENAVIKGGLVDIQNTAINTKNLSMSDGTVQSATDTGIVVSESASITGGKVVGDIYGVRSRGTITLGEDDGDISSTSPELVGGSFGLYIEGPITNFYDGILKGQIDGYNEIEYEGFNKGRITGTPLGGTVGESQETIDGNLYETDFVVPYVKWLKVGDVEYNNINEATDACPENEECVITVTNDSKVTFIQSFNDPNKNKKIVFDLQGHTIESTQTIYNNTDLTIIDSSTEKTGTFLPTRVTAITNNEKLTIENANFTTTYNIHTLTNKGSGTMIINHANFDVPYSGISNSGSLEINDININSQDIGMYNEGIVDFNDGIIEGKNIGVNIDGGTFKVHGGLIEGNKGIEAVYYGGVYMDGGRVHGKTGKAISTYWSGITIDGGTIIADNDTAVQSASVTTINDGYIEGTIGVEHRTKCNGYICWWEDEIITGGKIVGTTGYGAAGHGASFVITGGEIYGETDGIQNTGATCRIGDDDGHISTSVPLIQGKRYGVYTTSYITFNDGILKGKTKAHEGLISQIPDATTIKDDYEYINREEYKTQYIVEFTDWLQVGSQKFNSLTDACEAIGYSGTVKVIADAYVGFKQELPADKEITFDLNGHQVIMTQPLITKGTNTFKDSVGGGYLHNLRDYTIRNNGTLTIENGNVTSDYTYGIYNAGTLTINNINLKTTGGLENAGTAVINGGYFEGLSDHSIYNHGDTTINGGTITKTNGDTIGGYAGWVHVKGGEVINETDTAIDVGYSSGGSMSLEVAGGEVTGVVNGVDMRSGSALRISGGHIVATNGTAVKTVTGNAIITGGVMEGTIYGVLSEGTTTLGANDGTISIDLPVIKGDTYGLYIKDGSTLNFYDGILKGITNANYGQITNIPDRAQIFIDSEVINEHTYETKYLIMETDIAKNLNTGVIYTNLQDALNEAQSNETVQLLNNVPLYYSLVNNNQNNFTLDMNGYSISTNKPISNSGNLSIKNTSNKESVIKTSSPMVLFTNTNTLYLENVGFKNTSSDRYVLVSTGTLSGKEINIDARNAIQSTNTLNLTNSTITATGTAIDNSGLVKIDGGSYTGNYALYSNSNRNSEVKNAKFNGSFYNNRGNMEVYKCELTRNQYQTISNSAYMHIDSSVVYGDGSFGNSGTMLIEDSDLSHTGTIAYTSKINAFGNSGTMTIRRSTVFVDEDNSPAQEAVAINNSGTLTVEDKCTVSAGLATNTNGVRIGIRTTGNGRTTIDDSDILVQGGTTSYGVYVSDTNSYTTIVTGRIVVTNASVSYGAYTNLGHFIMGHEEGNSINGENVSQENPYVYAQGNTRGIGVKKVNGQFEFYDGIIWASRYAKPETTSLVEKLYEVTTYVDKDTGFEYAWLEYMPDDYQGATVALLNNVYYQSLQDAIDVFEFAPEGETIKLLKSVKEDLNVGYGKTAIINLNGHSVTGTTTNNGTLQVYNGSLQNFGREIIDTPESGEEGDESEEGEAEEESEPTSTVINNGTFIMGQDDEKVSSTNIRIVNEDIAVTNNGTFKMYDGYLEGNPTLGAGEIDEIADFARIHTVTESQYERKYLQSLDKESIMRGETALILTIDPNGGFYDNNKNIQTKFVYYNTNYQLTIPRKNACTFVGWEISDPDLIDENYLITVGIKDIDVKALWQVNDDAVAHIGDDYYYSLTEALDGAKDGDTIELLKNVEEDITNVKNVTINLGGHQVKGAFINNGILTILNGELYNPDGIGLVNLKTVTMGYREDGDVELSSIRIIGNELGIQQDGRFNFYDGYIEGTVTMNGTAQSVPQGFSLYTEFNNESNKQRLFLSGNPENAVASITSGEATQFFFRLPDAISTAKITGQEIRIEKDFKAPYEIIVPEDADVVINMNSHDITTANTIEINGGLKLYDLSETPGSITSDKSITNNGTLTVQGIAFHQTKSVDTLINNGTLVIKDNVIPESDLLETTTIEATDKYAIINNGDLTLQGGFTLSSNSYALKQNGTVNEITSGTIHGIVSTKDTSISEGSTITYTLQAQGGDLSVEDIELSLAGNYCIYTNGLKNATVSVKNVAMTCTRGIYTTSGSGLTINVDDSNITASEQGYRINTGSTTVNSANTEITASSYAVHNEIKGGNVYNLEGTYISTTTVAIYDNVSTNSHDKTFNLTGGLVQGKTHAIHYRCGDLYIKNTEVRTISTSRDHFAIYGIGWTGTYLYEGAYINAQSASGVYTESAVYLYDGSEVYAGANAAYGILSGYMYMIMYGGVIKTPGTSSYGVYANSSRSYIEIKDGLIDSKNVGIQLVTTGDDRLLYVNGGTIHGDTYGIYMTADHTIYVGNEEDPDSQNIPLITGGTYGIYRTNGKINFNNGRVRGYTGSYNNEVNGVKSGKDIYTTTEAIDKLSYATTDTSEIPIANYAKEGNGYAKITYIGESAGSCINGQEFLFPYKGSEDTFHVSCPGEYKLEVWGAQGGNCQASSNSIGGYGAYAVGTIELTASDTLYINVGGQGEDNLTQSGESAGGYNGGGRGYRAAGGGGATHIATKSGLLSTLEENKDSILIVAGAGAGGAASRYQQSTGRGGSGGGHSGENGYREGTYCTKSGDNRCGIAGNQLSGGLTTFDDANATYRGKFGQGGDAAYYFKDTLKGIMSGGGSGYYGGSGSSDSDADLDGGSGGGGSGYIDNPRLITGSMYGFHIPESVNEWVVSYLVNKEDFLQVGEETFNDLNAAIAALGDETEGTITVIADAVIQQSSTFPAGKTITFDLNGHSLETSKRLINKGDLIIINTDEEHEGSLTARIDNLIQNDSNLTLNNVKVDSKTTSATILANSGTGKLDIKKSKIYGNGTGVYITSAQKITFENSYMDTLSEGFRSDVNSAKLTIKDSEIKTVGISLRVENHHNNELTIENSKITSTTERTLYIRGQYNIVSYKNCNCESEAYRVLEFNSYNGNSNTLNIDGGTYKGAEHCLVAHSVRGTIKNATLETTGEGSGKYVLHIEHYASLTFNNSKLIANNASGVYLNEYIELENGSEIISGGSSSYGINNIAGSLKITDSKVTATGSASYGIMANTDNSSYTWTLNNAEISSNNVGLYLSTGTRTININSGSIYGANVGIYQSGANITTNIGRLVDENDAPVALNQQDPRIESENLTISKSNGVMNFYNGRLVTKNTIMVGEFNTLRPEMEVKYFYDYDDNESVTLSVGNYSSEATSNTPKSGNGYAKITYTAQTSGESASNPTTIETIGDEYKTFDELVFTYDLTKSSQEFITPVDGEYKIELWGAAGGDYNSTYTGGKGAYTSGKVSLSASDKLYVYVGERYNGYKNEMSYNGGGKGGYSTRGGDKNYNGGGATDIRLVSGDWDDFNSLKSRIMVAAGGGGANNYAGGAKGGDGGALVGLDAQARKYNNNAYYIVASQGGTQTKGGLYGSTSAFYQDNPRIGHFGIGGYDTTYTADYIYNAGGGSGYYGGGSGGSASSVVSAGGGGSSFISGYEGCDAIDSKSTKDEIFHTGQPVHYSNIQFTDSVMKAGNESMPTYDGYATMTGNPGSGHAKIDYLEGENEVYVKLETDAELDTYYLKYNTGDRLGTLPVPVSEGLTFEGWYLDDTLTKKVTSNTIINTNTTFYPKFDASSNYCNSLIGKSYTFDFTNNEQVFSPTCSGIYKLEVWGAQGGYAITDGVANKGKPGFGGYSTGDIILNKDELLYINVGGQGGNASLSSCATGGYNGGGRGTNDGGACGSPNDDDAAGAGGGATHIATKSGLLSTLENDKNDVLIVAGGGGGATVYSTTYGAGSGGGHYGGISQSTTSNMATQTEGYAFGQGQDGAGKKQGSNCSSTDNSCEGVAGGGGGWYGGRNIDFNSLSAGGGGSGYVGNSRISNGVMYGYNVKGYGYEGLEAYLDDRDGFLEVDGVVYNSFATAISAISETGTIKVLKDIAIKQENEFPAGKNITLDLNGKVVDTSLPFTNKGTLTIVDNSGSIGTFKNDYGNIIKNQGTLIVNAGKYESPTASAFYGVDGPGSITINEGVEITGKHGVYCDTKHDVTINKATITATNYAVITNAAESKVTINDSTITATGTSQAVRLNAKDSILSITDSYITAQSIAIYNRGQDNKIDITGGRIVSNTSHAICNEDSYSVGYMPSITLNNTEIVGGTNAIWLHYTYLYATNSVIRTTSTDKDQYSIYSNSYGYIKLTNSTIDAKYASGIRTSYRLDLIESTINAQASNSYGIYTAGGNVKVQNSTINTPGLSAYGIISSSSSGLDLTYMESKINSGNVGVYLSANDNNTRTIYIKSGEIYGTNYGIYQTGKHSTAIGDRLSDVSITNPSIEGGLYGLYTTADSVSMYSGVLKGAATAYNGIINNIKDGYEIFESVEELSHAAASLRSYSVQTAAEEATSKTPKIGNGTAKISYNGTEKSSNVKETVTEISTTVSVKDKSFDYSNSEQVYVVPKTGTYKIETWGGQGGTSICNGSLCTIGGYGGYSVGNVYLEAGTKLYINVGGRGGDGTLDNCAKGGYNGGGRGTNDGGACGSPRDNEAAGAGGGATSVATRSGLLQTLENYKESVLIVSGGGGGASWDYYAGSGGGYVGGTTSQTGTQSGGQISGYAFGKGEDANGAGESDGLGGGGGGWYGGYQNDQGGKESGTGGSGYIGNSLLTDKHMYCYNCLESQEADTLTISNGEQSCHLENPTADCAKEGNGYVNISYVSDMTSKEFEYTGYVQSFTAPESGTYLLETWGASGGDAEFAGFTGGYGGYSTGKVYLSQGETIYIAVGGKGESGSDRNMINTIGGWNGGGNGGKASSGYPNQNGGSGGGATHIAKENGLLESFESKLSSVLIVAGGGGGGSYTNGGNGGGYIGQSNPTLGAGDYTYPENAGGTQTTGYAFGLGQSGRNSDGQYWAAGGTGGGGGGLYGGKTYPSLGSFTSSGGAGGSGYIANPLLTDKYMYCYNCEKSLEPDTYTMSDSAFSCVSEDPTADCAKLGHGYAKVSLLSNTQVVEFDYTRDVQTFTAPRSGVYTLETWGAQGGSQTGVVESNGNYNYNKGGYGGYSKGDIFLNKDETIYIVVGGQGGDVIERTSGTAGGYNGGGAGGAAMNSGFVGSGGGGGATHIAKTTGVLSTLENNKQSVIIVAGGGGGASWRGTPGSGGGISGNGYTLDGVTITGGNQTTGYLFGEGQDGIQGTNGPSNCEGTAGGGGGWYGGTTSTSRPGSELDKSGGGGSGYIGNTSLMNKYMYCYNCETSTEASSYTKSEGESSCHSRTAEANCSKEGNGYARITYSGDSSSSTISSDYNSKDYTQTFTAPVSGYYKLDVWGAQGGTAGDQPGGYGGYSTGQVYLTAGQTININVGGQGSTNPRTIESVAGGYNGGGRSYRNNNSDGEGSFRGSGGGATSITIGEDLGELKNYSSNKDSIIIVAGGGAGASSWSSHYGTAGNGGGIEGTNGLLVVGDGDPGTGGTQSAGGNFNGSFGQGGDAIASPGWGASGGSGGGGGYYGGSYGKNNAGAGGGSGYIGNSLLTNKSMYCYNCQTSTDTNTYTKSNGVLSCHSSEPTVDCAKEGAGFARVTFVGSASSTSVSVEFEATSSVESFKAPVSGYYKLETWGAQGGNANKKTGGYGAYSKGTIYLQKDEEIFINVGKSGTSDIRNSGEGGYNGGGSAISNAYRGSGGGATSIAKQTGLLSQLSPYKGTIVVDSHVDDNSNTIDDSYYSSSDIIMVAAGGGGASYYSDGFSGHGGSGGGIKGVDGGGYIASGNSYGETGLGASQIAGGTGQVQGSFGKGADANNLHYGGAGGGAGFFGGAASSNAAAGGGGSSYIANPSLTDKYMYCYNCQTSEKEQVKTFSDGESSCHSSDPTEDCAKEGDGFARITLVSAMVGDDSEATITFITNKGTITEESRVYNNGDKLGDLPVPTGVDSDYEFEGWFLDEELTRKVTNDTIVHTDATLYASFKYVNEACTNLLGTTYTYDYTGDYQVFDVTCSGVYTLETWGAQGGNATYNTNSYRGGYGGYSVGDITLYKGEKLYVYVGGQGQSVNYQQTAANYVSDDSTGFNGGGYASIYTNNSAHAGGGGATHIATKYGLLSELNRSTESVIIVGAGGGGAAAHGSAPSYSGNGGSGGGYIGGDGTPANTYCYNYGTGGTQSSGGTYVRCADDSTNDRTISPPTNPDFGRGSNYNSFLTSVVYAGGGAGWFGGQSGFHAPGGGGSGYTGNERLSNTYMYGYDVPVKNTTGLNTAYLVLLSDKVINNTTNKKYTSLQTAFDEASSEDVIELLGDVSLAYNVTVPNKQVTLDLHGYDLTTTKTFVNNGTLSITDSTESGYSDIVSTSSNYFMTNNKILTISDITIDAYSSIDNKASNTLTLDSVTLESSDVSINNSGVLNATNINVSGGNYGIYNNSSGTSTINGVDINSTTSIYTAGTGKLSVTNANTITGTVNNSSSSFTLSVIGKQGSLITGGLGNKGITTFKNIAITHTYNSGGSSYYYLENTGSMTFDTVSLTLTDNANYNNDNWSEMVLNRGTFTSVQSTYTFNNSNHNKRRLALDNAGIMKSTNDTIVMTGGKRMYGYWNSSSNSLEVRNPNITITASTLGCGFESKTVTGVSGGIVTINAPTAYGYYVDTGSASIENTTYNVTGSTTSYGIYVNGGTMNMLSGTFNVEGGATYGAYNANGTLNISGGTINSNSDSAYGVYNNAGTTLVTGGNINATGANVYGISVSTGTLTLGVKDGNISATTPYIKANGTTTGYGINKGNGDFNYYDGKVAGTTTYFTDANSPTNTEGDGLYQPKEYTTVEDDIGYKYCVLETVF